MVKAIAPPTISLRTDAKVGLVLDPKRIHLFDGAGNAMLSAAGADGIFTVSYAGG